MARKRTHSEVEFAESLADQTVNKKKLKAEGKQCFSAEDVGSKLM